MSKLWIIGIGATALGLAMFFYFGNTGQEFWQSGVSTTTPMTTAAQEPTSERTVPSGVHEYRSNAYHFSLLYPESLSVKEYDEGSGAMTITFEYDDGHTASGFQIFITPFSGSQITDERFKQDIPSGVRKDLKEIKIDGATGASFYSENDILGATAEVWFIRGGYLYEVSTFKELAPWLDNIMQTWKFL